MPDTRLFARREGSDWTDLGGGNRRRVLLHTEELMVVAFAFEKGGTGAPHSHPHVQSSYIAEGVFEVTVGDQTSVLATGDAFIVPANTVHGVRALEAGLLIDNFTPRRVDFLI
jgi:quercetin dioxygenase-like cupin family protein